MVEQVGIQLLVPMYHCGDSGLIEVSDVEVD